MADLRNRILEIFSSITLFVSLLIIFGLIIFFINNPQTFERTRTVLILVFDVFYVGTIATVIRRKIKRSYNELGTYTGAILKLLVSEPLFVGILFIFNVVVIITFSYILPLYYLSVRVIDRTNSNVLSTAVVEDKYIEMEGRRYELQPEERMVAKYRSARFLVWGDSARVRINARGYSEYKSFIAWSGIPLRDLFRGKNFVADLLPEEPVKIVLNVSHPPSSMIHVAEPQDTTFRGAGVLYARVDERIRVDASHTGYTGWETTFVAREDMELGIVLKKKPGRILLRTFNEGGVEITRMDIYINGKLIDEKTGDVIVLAPGSYRVRLSKVLSGGERAVVDEFPISVDPEGRIKEITRTARIEHY